VPSTIESANLTSGCDAASYSTASAATERRYSDCEQAIAQAPDSATAWLGRGAALLRLGRAAEAQESFTRAASLQPDLAEAWYNQACAQVVLGDRFQFSDRQLAIFSVVSS